MSALVSVTMHLCQYKFCSCMTAFHDVMAYDLLTATEHVSGIKCNDPRKESHSLIIFHLETDI